MAKLLAGQATGSEAQEIKKMLLTLLEIPAGQQLSTTTSIKTNQTRHNTCRGYISPDHLFNWSSSGSKGQNRATGWERLIRSHSLARFSFELSGNLN